MMYRFTFAVFTIWCWLASSAAYADIQETDDFSLSLTLIPVEELKLSDKTLQLDLDTPAEEAVQLETIDQPAATPGSSQALLHIIDALPLAEVMFTLLSQGVVTTESTRVQLSVSPSTVVVRMNGKF